MTEAEKKTDDIAATENVAEAPQMEGQPSPEQIAEMVKGQARVQNCIATLTFLSNQANQMLTMMTGGNTRLALAIAAELHLFYQEAVRRSVQVTPTKQGMPTQDNAAENNAGEKSATDAENPSQKS